ncbi:hypothetical protein MKX03_013275 [Papaver bracteatum]|nr:hypothetical protein MKX03_013275 [Papaver bracteatum]
MGTSVTWGGEITNWRSKRRHTSTQMVVDENNVAKDLENVETIITDPNCYNLKIDKDHHDTNGYGFYYGGPGYNDNCQ